MSNPFGIPQNTSSALNEQVSYFWLNRIAASHDRTARLKHNLTSREVKPNAPQQRQHDKRRTEQASEEWIFEKQKNTFRRNKKRVSCNKRETKSREQEWWGWRNSLKTTGQRHILKIELRSVERQKFVKRGNKDVTALTRSPARGRWALTSAEVSCGTTLMTSRSWRCRARCRADWEAARV